MTLPTAARPSDRRRVVALDGLRGLAVLGVLVFHGGLLPGGFLGVSAFFTLSGFLICQVLLAEIDATGGVSLRRFWARRARRLLPAAFVCVGLVLVYAATVATADQVRSLRGDVLAALGYVANWRFVAVGRDYGRLFADPSPVQHFWSLAIEEQFYVVFPLVVVATVAVVRRRATLTTRPGLAPGSTGSGAAGGLVSGRVVRVWLAVVFAVGAVVSVVVSVLSGPVHAYYGTDTRAGELLIGALTACLAGASAHGIHHRRVAPVARRLAPFALALVVVWWVTVRRSDDFVARGGLFLHAVAVAVLITGLVASRGTRLHRLLSWGPLVDIGRVSYGAYLYHWPVYLWLTADRTSIDGAALLLLRVTVALALSAASWHYVEQPILDAPVLRRDRLRLTVPAIAASLVLVSTALTSGAPRSAVSFTPPPSPPLPPPTAVVAAAGAGPSVAVTELLGHDAAAPAVTPVAGPATDVPAPDATPATATDPTTITSVTAVATTAGAPTGGLPAAEAANPGAATDPLVTPARRRAVVAAGETPRILVAGDSAALTLGDGIARWASDTGRAQVWDAGSLGCAIARGGVHRYVTYPAEANPAVCDRWATVRAQQVAEIRPHLVVVMSGTWDVVDRKFAGTDTWTHLGNADADAYFEAELRAFVDVVGAGGATVVWLNHPRIKAGVKEGLDGPFPESDPARIERLNEIAARVAASRDDLAIVDVRSFLQRQPGGELDPKHRPDGIHWSRDAGRQDAAWLAPALLSLIDLPQAAGAR